VFRAKSVIAGDKSAIFKKKESKEGNAIKDIGMLLNAARPHILVTPPSKTTQQRP
jgi:hypothetical protein